MEIIDGRSTVLADEAAARSLEPLDVTGVDVALLPHWLEQMLVIREFEEATQPLSRDGKIPAGTHQAVGQEAVAVGVAATLAETDIAAGSHRAHHHVLAKGLDPRNVMAELFGRSTGSAGGRGGTMHVADFAKGFYGSNGIVGAGVGLALGAALAAQMRDSTQVAVGFFGDGGANTGRVWEFVNLAAVWRLPLVVVCENNLYAVDTDIRTTMAGNSIAERAAGFGLPAVQIDGQDVCAVFRAAAEAHRRAATGGGPTFIEAMTYRYYGHSTGGAPEPYRTPDEIGEWRVRDPILRLWRTLVEVGGASVEDFLSAEQSARAVVRAAIEFAEASPWPESSTATDDVMAPDMKTLFSEAGR